MVAIVKTENLEIPGAAIQAMVDAYLAANNAPGVT